jgi:hypothetical protein
MLDRQRLELSDFVVINLRMMPTSHATFTWDVEKPTLVKPAGTATVPSATGKTCLKRFLPHRLL